MNKEKQIEEMAVEFAKINCNPKGCYSCNLCDEYGSLELNCEDYLHYRTMAETFYNAGYRKIHDDNQKQCVCYALGCQMAERLEIKVAREIIADLKSVGIDEWRYPIIAELKKKYAEGNG